jgi:hypothetical protein
MTRRMILRASLRLDILKNGLRGRQKQRAVFPDVVPSHPSSSSSSVPVIARADPILVQSPNPISAVSIPPASVSIATPVLLPPGLAQALPSSSIPAVNDVVLEVKEQGVQEAVSSHFSSPSSSSSVSRPRLLHRKVLTSILRGQQRFRGLTTTTRRRPTDYETFLTMFPCP